MTNYYLLLIMQFVGSLCSLLDQALCNQSVEPNTDYVEWIHVKQVKSIYYYTVLVCFCIYLPDKDLVEVETHRRDISDKYLLFISNLLEQILCDQCIGRSVDYVAPEQ